MCKLLVKFGIILSIFTFLPSIFFAQSMCNLQFGIFEFKDDGTSEQFPIKDSKVKLVDTKTNKSLKVKNYTNFTNVQNVKEGEYKVTISKQGFQNTIKNVLVDCSFANSQNEVSEIVFLWKGSSKQNFVQGFSESGSFFVAKQGNEKDNNSKISSPSSLVKPEYPKAAIAVRAKGKVEVQVTINELGYVIFAKAVSGHPLLQNAAIDAAKKTKFGMTFLQGIPVKVSGIVVYNFG